MRIFQGYFDEISRRHIDPVAEPVDISFNLGHPHFEYNIFKTLLENGTMNPDEGPVGFLSWKFKTKTHLDVASFAAFCKKEFTVGADVAFINPMIAAEALYKNVWEQAYNVGHSEILDMYEAIFLPDEKSRLEFMPKSIFACCNYFVGNAKFWARYIAFCEEIIARIEKLKETQAELYARIHTSAGYLRNGALDYRPFILERLFPCFLALNTDLVRANVDHTVDIYISKFGEDLGNYLFLLSIIKNRGIIENRAEFLLKWDFERKRKIENNPTDIWHMDDPEPQVAQIKEDSE